MRLSPLAACALAGCNWVLGLDAPHAGLDADAIDAADDATVIEHDAADGPDASEGIDAEQPAILAVSAGGAHTCVLRGTAVRCWGLNISGQLGYGNQINVGDDELPAQAGDVPIGGGVVVEVAAGASHTCVVVENAGVRCWGTGANGRLGLVGTTSIGDDELPSVVGVIPLGVNATHVTAGGSHSCAVTSQNHVRCWGAGADGRLGYGDVFDVGDGEPPSDAGDIAGIGPIYQVAAGASHTCAMRIDGTVVCWGLGANGRLGYRNEVSIGDTEDPGETVSLAGSALQIVAGDAHTCVRFTTGAVTCWGTGAEGALGYSSTEDIGNDELPSGAGFVSIGGNAKQLAAGSGHTCALLVNGAVRCWGRNDHGQLGYGNRTPIGDDETPASAGDVELGGMAAAITAGGDHTCALMMSGVVRCWGAGAFGQLGTMSISDVGDDELPTAVPPIEP